MIVCRTRVELETAISAIKRAGKTTGFVPTMGALHEGHLSLVRTARENAQAVAVSIFVNPTQFGPNEDFARYPRTTDKDLELLAREAVDLVWLPTVLEMYGEGEMVSVNPGPVAETFEGAIRPGHFAGVLTVVAKLLQQVKPELAVFGEKDAQQLFLVRKLVADLCFPVRIVAGETVREANGLAISSRNVFLKAGERAIAVSLYQSLMAGKAEAEVGRSLGEIQSRMKEVLEDAAGIETQYATVVSDRSFAEIDPPEVSGRLIVAAKIGSVRLIDNIRYGLHS